MSMPVLQAEPRCVADAAPTAAMAIPCDTVAGASLCEAVAWQAKAGGRLGKHALTRRTGRCPRALRFARSLISRTTHVYARRFFTLTSKGITWFETKPVEGSLVHSFNEVRAALYLTS